jgi:hypothetical protein
MGDDKVIATILDTMHLLDQKPEPAGTGMRGVTLR